MSLRVGYYATSLQCYSYSEGLTGFAVLWNVTISTVAVLLAGLSVWLWRDRRRSADLQVQLVQASSAAANSAGVLEQLGHELRNPLHAILMHSENLVQTLAPDQRASALEIQDAVEVLLVLARDVAAYATVANPGERIEHELGALLQELRAHAGSTLRSKGVHFEVHVEPGSPTRVQAHASLSHLVRTVLAHSVAVTTHGHVEVTVHAVESDSSPLRISIEDTSALPADAARRLFEPFGLHGQTYQGNPTGTGLHLHVARKLARELGGDVTYSPRPGGALFDLSIPVQVLAKSIGEAQESSSVVPLHDIYARHRGRVRPLRVLVAEDQESNQRVIAGALEKAGHSLELASTGDEAQELIGSDAFDVVVLDLRLPGIHGLNILKLARIMPAAASTSFIVLTGDSDPETERACRDAGAAAFLPKPLSARRLLDSIELVVPEADGSTRAMRTPGAASKAVREQMADALRYVAQIEADSKDWPGVMLRVRALRGIAHYTGSEPLRALCNQVLELSGELPPDRRRRLAGDLAAAVDASLVALAARG